MKSSWKLKKKGNKLIGKLKGSDYSVNQISKRERGLKENREEMVTNILHDQDAIERERQLMMNRVSQYNPEDGPAFPQRKELKPNLLSRYKSMPDIQNLNLKNQGNEFLKLEQDHKNKNFQLTENGRNILEVNTKQNMGQTVNYNPKPKPSLPQIQPRAPHTSHAMVPPPFPGYNK